MGVHGLWELLAPVGRRVSVETLAGKKLAIDASIWMIQFMKAMRDDKGEMVRNAHILGFFRRICKLLYLRTRPVFVFDGGTPALKRRTVIARRRQRENAQANIRKTAEKMLLNQLKAMRLKELAADLQKQRQENGVKGKNPVLKGKNPVLQEPETGYDKEKRNDDMGARFDQEQFDEMLAASLAAEENEGFRFHPSTSDTHDPIPDRELIGEDDDDGDEEIILPEMHGKVDPAVLAALPPSMQLDLLVQMRERLMAENRQEYQKVKQAPTKFSELQIQSYLKTVAFRREIDGVQKSAAGRGIGGMQTSRIASEANREFIFSSSFTGDKQTLTSVGKDNMISDQSRSEQASCSIGKANEVLKTNDNAVATTTSEFGKELDGVETYLDDRGRLRVSRVRALGIRMTRDLQRNLDLMKDIQQENEVMDQEQGTESSSGRILDLLGDSSRPVYHQSCTDQENNEINDDVNNNAELKVINGSSIEISFEDALGLENGHDEDDAFFAHLVACDPMMDIPVHKFTSAKQSSLSTSNEWEEGITVEDREEQLTEGVSNDEEEVVWEEEPQGIPCESSSVLDESKKFLSKGDLEEDADFQEAIRRSLEDRGCPSRHMSHEDHVRREMCRDKLDMQVVDVSDERKSGHELESLATGTDQSFFGPAIISGEKSVVFLKRNTQENQLNLEHLNQEAGRNEVSTGEKVPTSDDVTDEGEPFVAVKQLINFRTEDSERSPEIKQLNNCIPEAAPNSRNSASGSSTATSLQCRLLNSGSPHQALDDNSPSISEIGKITADEPINDIDVAEPYVRDELYSDPPIEMEKTMGCASFAYDDEKQEILKENLEGEIRLLGKECEELGSKQRKLERNAESVSSEMFAECQELLQMFGLPYIVAPMEAEAQCAFMELSNIVDGVVTDDSDAFLFGARCVYKNIFDDRKYVETYLMKDIEMELGLDREKMINVALLLGSDYTEGISGIGIVNAIEVVNAFPDKDGLREFREWIESPDLSILSKMDTQAGGDSRKKGSKCRGSIHNPEGMPHDQNEQQSGVDAEREKQIFMDKHRNVSKNWHIPSSFPSDTVISAYLSPQVDKSTEPFSWGKPDLFALRKLCLEKFGWVFSKADELLLPVLKEYNKHETQLRLEAFYTFNERFAKIRSKRIKKAVKGITGNISSEMIDGTSSQQSGKGRKRKVKPREDEDDESGLCDPVSSNLKDVHRSKGMRNRDKSSSSKFEQASAADCNNIIMEETRGRRGKRGRGNRPLSSRGTKKQDPSAVTVHSSGREEEIQCGKSEESHPLRRSERPRKSVNYTVSDESDDVDKDRPNDGSATKSSGDQAARVKDNENEIYGVDVGTADGLFVDETSENNLGVDEAVSGKADDSRKNDDYLQFGGGFCSDENEAAEEADRLASCHTGGDVSELADSLVQESRDRNTPNRVDDLRAGDEIQNHYSMQDETRDDSMDQNQNSLRAMPNLRRKKRRT